jgi:hypothetical protein
VHGRQRSRGIPDSSVEKGLEVGRPTRSLGIESCGRRGDDAIDTSCLEQPGRGEGATAGKPSSSEDDPKGSDWTRRGGETRHDGRKDGEGAAELFR